MDELLQPEKEERIEVKKTAKIRKLFDLFPQLTSIQAFYSLKDESIPIEISIGKIKYNDKYEGKEVFLDSLVETESHDKVWSCKLIPLEDHFNYERLLLYESWLEEQKEAIVYYDKNGKEHLELDREVVEFIKKINSISGVNHDK